MINQPIFYERPEVNPTIYVYSLPDLPTHRGYVKVGYTDRDVMTRIHEQTHTAGLQPRLLHCESAMRPDGTVFSDKDVHRILKARGLRQMNQGQDKNEWFECSVGDVKAAILQIKQGIVTSAKRTATFGMRPEQYRAVERTMAYFASAKADDPTRPPKFLWNAKMRFGKTFASYQLVKKMGLSRVLVLTFKPAVADAWREDLLTHVDFEGWQFVTNRDAAGNHIDIVAEYNHADKSKPIVVFGSFQDLLGKTEAGGIKAHNEFIHTDNWDLVIFDEYHFGAWRENVQKLFEDPDEEASADFDLEKYQLEEAGNAYNESFLPITTSHYLFLSGTPFRAINSGEFIEEQIFNWTYSDEQRAKEEWVGSDNPYLSLPRMVMLAYKMPDDIRQIAMQGEFDEFDLNVFFSTKGKGKDARFVYENEVQKWLDLIRGAHLPSSTDDLKLGRDKRPPMPYHDTRLLHVLSHTLWFLPKVDACYAMYNLLMQNQNSFYHSYTINICAGTKAGIGIEALKPVEASMADPLSSKTITLSCGKLTTGVTVRPWTGVFMLRNLKSPETYFQTAFRVQSPWEMIDEQGNRQIIKQECYVFDFALDRALHQISDYSCRLDMNESNPEKKVEEFIKFLPVLAYDGSSMRQVNAQEILDFTMAGTSATLLAKRWESALLVNVDNETLKRLMANPDAMAALQNIEGFRSLNQDIQTIINKSEAVKKVKSEKKGQLTPEEKKKMTEEEKEYKSARKKIQEKLIKFATRIPIFMYLTDYREYSVRDVITQLEPGLFKKVTGLEVKDFELLMSIGIFNNNLMDQAVFQFKRYEDASLVYTGINRHAQERVIGGFDSVIKREEYEALFYNQHTSMETPTIAADTMPDEVAEPTAEKPVTRKVITVPSVTTSRPSSPQPSLVTTQYTARTTNTATAAVTTVASKHQSAAYIPPNVKVGDTVKHRSFGEGKIVRFEKDQAYILVAFQNGEKKFQFPQAFQNGFLTV